MSKRKWEILRELEIAQEKLEESIENLMSLNIDAEPLENVLDIVTNLHTEFLDYTPENIDSLTPNQIFVFGSNLGGFHGGGAARKAYDDFGAIWGQGEGLQGDSYALPTKDEKIQTLPLYKIKKHVDTLFKVCCMNSDKQFLITKVGCGLAGLSVENIGPMFKNFILLPNVVLPKEFYDICTK